MKHICNLNSIYVLLFMSLIETGFTLLDNEYLKQSFNFLGTSNNQPTITQVSCSRMGKQTSYNSELFQGYFLFDTEYENTLTIEGFGFGLEGRADTRGVVTLTANNCYTPIVKSWTDTKIEIKFNVHPAASPGKSYLFIKTAGKNPKTVRYDFKFVPAINGHQYGECSWWTGKRRKEEKRPIPKPAFTDPNFKLIDANYTPQAKDIWKWGLDHQAIVEFVKAKIDPRGKDLYYTFHIDISEANSDHRGTPKICYSTTVEVEYKYKGYKMYSTKILSGVFGKPNGEQASHYYR